MQFLSSSRLKKKSSLADPSDEFEVNGSFDLSPLDDTTLGIISEEKNSTSSALDGSVMFGTPIEHAEDIEVCLTSRLNDELHEQRYWENSTMKPPSSNLFPLPPLLPTPTSAVSATIKSTSLLTKKIKKQRHNHGHMSHDAEYGIAPEECFSTQEESIDTCDEYSAVTGKSTVMQDNSGRSSPTAFRSNDAIAIDRHEDTICTSQGMLHDCCRYFDSRIIDRTESHHLTQSPISKSLKKNRSSLTWDESFSSQEDVCEKEPSTLSNGDDDIISELSEHNKSFFVSNSHCGEKSIPLIFQSNKAKYVLILLACVLVLLIGLLMGKVQLKRNAVGMSSQQQSFDPIPTIVFAPPPTTEDDSFVDAATHSDDELFLEDNPKPLSWTHIKKDGTKEQSDPKSGIFSGYDYTVNTDFLVGVYYYPWHGPKFHNCGGYMRKLIEPRHVPALGEYNDSDPEVIKEHMKMFRKANIGLLVASWWGPDRLEDSNTKDVIMEHEDIGNLKIAIHYETTSRLGTGRDKFSNAKTDIEYMCEKYFNHDNYYKINGRPVVFIYISRKLHSVGTLEESLLLMRSTASKCNHNLYLIGDSVFEEAPDTKQPHVPFWYFDAVTNYDVYGSSGRPEGYVGTDRVDNYYRQQREWKRKALQEDCRYIPAASPGYNDRGVRMEREHPPLSRRLTAGSLEGSLFHYQLKQAKELVDPKVDNLILVNSFNEWHEDTQIEPVVGNPASEPFNFTKGLEYVGYGDLYLNILGASTSKDTNQHKIFDYLL